MQPSMPFPGLARLPVIDRVINAGVLVGFLALVLVVLLDAQRWIQPVFTTNMVLIAALTIRSAMAMKCDDWRLAVAGRFVLFLITLALIAGIIMR